MTFDDKNMIQICSQILEFSDHSNANISAVRLGKFPQSPFSHGPLWRILFLAWVSGDVWWNGSYLHWVDATKSCRTHRCFAPFKYVSTLYRLVCLNKKNIWIFGNRWLVIGHCLEAPFSLLFCWRYLHPICWWTLAKIPSYSETKKLSFVVFFLTIYELMIKKTSILVGWPSQKVILYFPP
jgi:hypothetical protein